MRPTMQQRRLKQLRQLEPYIGRWETPPGPFVGQRPANEVNFVADQQLVHVLVRVAIDF
jgi:hypothetical protein